MNSLLQTLYHIPSFRRAVYHMPTDEEQEAHSSMPLALQSVFYCLQYAKDGDVATEDLTRSLAGTRMTPSCNTTCKSSTACFRTSSRNR